MRKSSTCRCRTIAKRSTCLRLEIGLTLMGPTLRLRQSLARPPLTRLFPNKGHGPQKLVLERVWGRASRSTGVSCGQKVDFNPFRAVRSAIDGYDLSPGQPIAISKPANFKVLVSQWSPTAQVDPFLEFFLLLRNQLHSPRLSQEPKNYQTPHCASDARAPRACLVHLGASYTVGARATCHINEFIEHALVYIISQNRKLSRSKPLFTPFLTPIRPYLDINHFSVLDWAHIT